MPPWAPDKLFIADLGISYRVDGDLVVGHLPVIDPLCVPDDSRLRVGVLATAADVVAGWGVNRLVFPRIPLTVELTVHRLRALSAAAGAELRVVARVLKSGRTTTVAEARFFEPGTPEPVVLSHVGFVVSPRPQDVFDAPLAERPPQAASLTAPILDDLGVHVSEPGVAQLERGLRVLQPAGTIQGGAVALLLEAAAESVLAAPVDDLEVRYLSTIRIGPAEARACVIGAGRALVEVRDTGREGRLAAVAIATAGGSRA